MTGPRLALRLTGRGAAALAVAVALVVAAWAVGSPGSLPLAAALGAALALAPVLAWTRARQAVAGLAVHARVRPGVVPVGGRADLEVTVAAVAGRPLAPVGIEWPDNRWSLNPDPPAPPVPPPWRGWLVPGPSALARVVVPRPGAGATRLALGVPTARRGRLELGPLRVWIHDPLGLVGAAVSATRPVRLVVHPRPSVVPSVMLTNSIGPASTTAGPGVTAVGRGDWGGDFAELRPYRVGDRLSSIHWQSLARYGVALVRQFDPEASGLVRIVVDDRAGAHHRHTYEEALSTTLALIEAAVHAGLPVELSTFSGRRATVAPTPEGLAGVLELLATMGPRPSSEWSHLDLLVSEFGGFTIVTTATGAPRLPEGLRRRAHVVTS